VHACGQVVHFDTEGRIPTDRLEEAANNLLAPEIALRCVEETRPDFHARFSALRRTYHYWIYRGWAPVTLGRYVLSQPELGPAEVGRMREALQPLVGRHDFRAFCAGTEPEANTVRTLLAAEIEEFGALLRLRLTADAFLRSMARTVVGSLLQTARGKREPESLARALAERRLDHPLTAPAHGLWLARVEYAGGYPPPRDRGFPEGPFLETGTWEDRSDRSDWTEEHENDEDERPR
jgi:tRNA pseudouridine38-40 synthase